MQGVDNLFLVDTMQKIMQHICRIADVKYGDDDKKDISLRVITDHIRSTTFMIGDGVMPSNEGRGYVLRRLLRRAARHGRLLGIDRSFLAEVAETVIAENKGAYPELEEKRAMILKLINVEEESFAKTIDQGLQILNNLIENHSGEVLSGEDAFRLNDTYGFPLDLTKEIVAERGMSVDEKRFHELMQEQRERARNARKNAGADAWAGENDILADVPETKFLGYELASSPATVLAILKDGERVDSATAGDEIALILDQTTFYAESGGQVGDVGPISAENALIAVDQTTKNHAKNYIHHGTVQAGVIAVGDHVETEGNPENHRAIMRNHTAAHLLQAALRTVLGDHVEQAGQLVDETVVRFDFTHFSALTAEELRRVETIVNNVILNGTAVDCREMPIEEAKKLGAMALFGEKYGNVVRVVSVDNFSREFCGGTHVDNTGKIGLFKIVSESSVAAGVRRIEAVTGMNALHYMNGKLEELNAVASAMKAGSAAGLVQRAEQMTAELKEKDRVIESLNAKLADMQINGLFEGAKMVNGVRVITALFSATEPNALRTMCDKVRENAPNMVAVLAATHDGKANIAVTVGKSALEKGLNAGKIVREVAKVAGGNGGGKPDFAMAGAKDLTKLDEALAAAEGIVAEMVAN